MEQVFREKITGMTVAEKSRPCCLNGLGKCCRCSGPQSSPPVACSSAISNLVATCSLFLRVPWVLMDQRILPRFPHDTIVDAFGCVHLGAILHMREFQRTAVCTHRDFFF